MDKFIGFFKTREGLAAVVSAALGFFVAQGLISDDVAKLALFVIANLLTLIFDRVVKKSSAGNTPFQPATK